MKEIDKKQDQVMKNTFFKLKWCLALIACITTSLYGKSMDSQEEAIFAGGCFWCMQHDFDHLKGVTSTTVGYEGGDKKKPTYGEVSSGKTNFVESVKVTFDPGLITYEELLDYFWHNIDPTRDDGQFCDTGEQYRPVIFYLTKTQQTQAIRSKQSIISRKKISPVLVQILPAKTFYPAEDYHQKYYKKNPVRYNFYRYSCGRDKRLKEIWGSKNHSQK